MLGETGASQNVLAIMRRAARNAVVIRHTFNLVDLPIVVAAKTGTAQFGSPDSHGNLPWHTWFVGFVPKNPWKTAADPKGWKAVARTDSNLAVLVLAYNSGTKGNAATEIAKYYLQMHFNIKKDYRLLRNLKHVSNYYSN